MNLEEVRGVWRLCGRAEGCAQIDLDSPQPHEKKVDGWLAGSGVHLLDQLQPCAGLLLRIEEDGTVQEQVDASARFPWFDDEGVLNDRPNSLAGKITSPDCYLMVAGSQMGNWPLRYDDGDTLIADRFELQSGRLLRSVSVVTDELYCNRHLFVYERAQD